MTSAEELFTTEMEQMSQQFPGVKVPPNCFVWMNIKVLRYESRIMLSIELPVTEAMLNPMGVMQGGFVTAAFDNAFGPLSYVAAKNPCTTLDMHTQYIRPVPFDELLTVTVRVVSRGSVSMHLSGEACNRKGKLVATCSSNMIVMR